MKDDTRFRILIVDDEKSSLNILGNILKNDYDVLIAKSGQAAVKKAVDERPDLILLDVLMPDMNGFIVLLKLKENDATRSIPVIFITGLDDPEDEEKGLVLGAVDYIKKPFNNAIVRVRVRTHIQIVKQIRTIEQLGMIDALTGIPNRRSFDERMMTEWSRARREEAPISLLMMDVDKFKTYNDTYGHPQGDVLLQTIARVFEAAVRRSADMVARMGGEEFAAILPGTDLEGAVAVGETIRENVRAAVVPFPGTGKLTSATISVGAASITPRHGNAMGDFIRKADEMLYNAKKSGRDKVCS
ncbi:MAG: diguanylate cyclase [Synergistaceae bacterium]|jgi:diguanylate cyclase (GGDEF)-like protein|nr:diguanylate cyclase [Synergistaceae bacterium]